MRTAVTRLAPLVLAFCGLLLIVGLSHIALAATYSCPTTVGGNGTSVGTKCYKYYSSQVSWSDAKTACAGLGGQLATINSLAENTAVSSIRGNTEPWIGAADDNSLVTGSSEGEFFWIGDSTKFWTGGQGGSAFNSAYANWSTPTNEPNNALDAEDCVQIYVSAQWNDRACSTTLPYVCEFEATDTSSSDSSSSAASTTGGSVRSSTLQSRISNAASRHSAAPKKIVGSVLRKSNLPKLTFKKIIPLKQSVRRRI